MTAKIDDGMTYLNATQALGGSDGSGFTIISEEDEVFTMSFHVTKNCTDKLFIDTIHFSTSGSKKVILIIELQVMAKWVRKVLILYPILSYYQSAFFLILIFFAFVFSYQLFLYHSLSIHVYSLSYPICMFSSVTAP